MSARRTTRSPNRLLITATLLVATAALLRLLSPDGETDAGTEPSPSTSPTRSTQHPAPGPPIPRPTTWTPHNPQHPPADLTGS